MEPEQHTEGLGCVCFLSLEDPKPGWRKALWEVKNLSIRLTAMPGTLLGVPGACQLGAGQSSAGAGGRGVGEVGSRNYKDLNVTTEEGRTPWGPDGL